MKETHHPARERLVQEAVRLYQRYAREVVEEFDLCPWAAGARRAGAVCPRVMLQSSWSDLGPSLTAIAELAALPEVAIGILIYPCMSLSAVDFEQFSRRLREKDAERREAGQVPFATAAFHPEASADLSRPERLIPFIRKTPDPTLQLIRRSALERVLSGSNAGTAFADPWMLSPVGLAKAAGPGLTDQIAIRNLETVQRVGIERLEAVLASIARDRSESYARLQG